MSNTDDYKEHKGLFHLVKSNFSEKLRMMGGGDVKLRLGDKKRAGRVSFSGMSFMYGCYDHLFLNKFKKDIERELSLQYGCKINVKIEKSS